MVTYQNMAVFTGVTPDNYHALLILIKDRYPTIKWATGVEDLHSVPLVDKQGLLVQDNILYFITAVNPPVEGITEVAMVTG